MTTNNIRYLYNAETGIELIFCKNSTISYPLHNHVSVLTIGIILDDSVILKTNKETRAYKQNETFAIFLYEPHRWQFFIIFSESICLYNYLFCIFDIYT